MYPGIPVLRPPAAAAVLVANLLLPGVGTFVLATRGGGPALALKGGLQLATTVLLVGWLWALVTSVKAVANAREGRGGEPMVTLRPTA